MKIQMRGATYDIKPIEFPMISMSYNLSSDLCILIGLIYDAEEQLDKDAAMVEHLSYGDGFDSEYSNELVEG